MATLYHVLSPTLSPLTALAASSAVSAQRVALLVCSVHSCWVPTSTTIRPQVLLQVVPVAWDGRDLAWQLPLNTAWGSAVTPEVFGSGKGANLFDRNCIM